MDKLRAVVTRVAAWVARTRLVTVSRGLPAQDSRLHDGERGQGLAEYALILGSIAVVAIASLVFLGGTITEMFYDPIDERFGEILCNVIGICP
jgi:Flp pilus assembly pilin Flp